MSASSKYYALSKACLVGVFLICTCVINAQAATITVNSLADTEVDDGECTFREALISANSDSASGDMTGECDAGSGDDVIEFGVAGTIQPAGELPEITTVIHIDGYSAPGASVNTLELAQGTDAVLTIELDGANAGNFPGLSLDGNGASGSIIEGLVINNSANGQCCNTTGIYTQGLNGGAPTWIRGNFIQVNSDGNAARPKGSRGIWATGTDIIIGNESGGALVPAYTNLISGSDSDGVLVNGGTGAVVRGNLIGTDRTGTVRISNSNGIVVDGSSKVEVSNNVVSGSNQIGVYLRSNITASTVSNNFIGTSADGENAIPNNTGGIRLQGNRNIMSTSQEIEISDNLVSYNLCGNCSGGIVVGESITAHTTDGVRVQRNRVFDNAGLEIDLAETNAANDNIEFGVTLNDPNDPDEGPNRLQNFPQLTLDKIDGMDAAIQVDLDSEPSKTYTIDFYQTSACDSSGYGGAEIWLADAVLNTDANGDASDGFEITLAESTGFVTATATQNDHGTSEFSLCLALVIEDVFEDGFEDIPPP